MQARRRAIGVDPGGTKMAIAEAHLAARFNRDGFHVFEDGNDLDWIERALREARAVEHLAALRAIPGLVVRIQPDEGVSPRFQAKLPGLSRPTGCCRPRSRRTYRGR